MADLALDLTVVGRNDLATAGGKGANLAELLRAGFPVPAAFVVTTAAYDDFVRQNELAPIIEAALRKGASALREGPAAAEHIRAAFGQARVPVAVSQAIRARYQNLGLPTVAVRSSATAEDLPEATFAGQHDTFLNIGGIDDLLDAVRDCWASLWTDRAVTYRERQGIDQSFVKLAVVVQRMVEPDAAGVLFTANPITGARDEVMVNANPGLGEAVVAGVGTPDHFVLRHGRLGWRVVERQLGRREAVIRGRAEGGTEIVSTHVPVGEAALPDRVLRRLTHLATQIERHFGAPQDIEWAWADGELFILQARPMTALPIPRRMLGLIERQMLHQLGERFQIRPYPLDLTTWGAAIWGAAVAPLLRLMGLANRPLEQIFEVEDGVAIGLSGRLAVHPTPLVVFAPIRVGIQARRHDPRNWETDPVLLGAFARARALADRDITTASWEQLLALLAEGLDLPNQLAGEVRLRYLPRAALAMGLLRVLLVVLHRGRLFGPLLSGVPTRTLDANAELEALSAKIRADPALARPFAFHEPVQLMDALGADPRGQAFLADLRKFLHEYGHREVYVAGASQPTWGDAPELVLGILKGLARSEPKSRPARASWEAARDEVLAHPLLSISPFRGLFLAALDAARCLLRVREDSHFYATLPLPVVRHISLEFGDRLTSAGALDAPADVFHLTRNELERCRGYWPPPPRLSKELRSAVQRRKERRAALDATPFIDLSMLGEMGDSQEALLRGAPGSPGTAVGRVRVVQNEAEFSRLQPGEVLVAPYTNPAWTPLFRRAAAVVADVGSAASHAAIVAREYEIPAVMGTIDGTRRVQDGQQVRVDGTRGLVFRVSDGNEYSDHLNSRPAASRL